MLQSSHNSHACEATLQIDPRAIRPIGILFNVQERSDELRNNAMTDGPSRNIPRVGDPIPDDLRLHQPGCDVLGAAIPSAGVMSVPRPVIDTSEDTHSRTSRRGHLIRSPQRLNLSNTVRFESCPGH
ncbi:hypothetical protein CDAR_524421 [Caerostris darwini]|uniref:Uncharacterized protein n=1 Tax=Caerostris darwini TaxID=1538125 RepID=A0AAV4VXW0_9ARAC|nr:hypothetical protein CDAR_524421 [Caerostris darwini]